MTNQPRIPDALTRARSVAQLRKLVQRMDKNIAELDEFIVRLEADNHRRFDEARQRGNARRLAVQNQDNS